MKKLIMITMMMLLTVNVCAALPPFSQSKREIEAILSSQEIYNYIPSGDVIHQIVKTPTGYLIITNYRILPVSIRHMPRQNLGPARFSIRFHKAIETTGNKPGDNLDPSESGCEARNHYKSH